MENKNADEIRVQAYAKGFGLGVRCRCRRKIRKRISKSRTLYFLRDGLRLRLGQRIRVKGGRASIYLFISASYALIIISIEICYSVRQRKLQKNLWNEHSNVRKVLTSIDIISIELRTNTK